jgi:hypothetical protein
MGIQVIKKFINTIRMARSFLLPIVILKSYNYCTGIDIRKFGQIDLPSLYMINQQTGKMKLQFLRYVWISETPRLSGITIWLTK